MKLLTEKEVAAQISMSVHWLRRMRITGGAIPFIKMPGVKGAVRYEPAAVEAFLRGRMKKSTSQF
jgi:hypothetical protein